MMRWEQPEWLWGLFLVPVYWLGVWAYRRWQINARKKLADAHLLPVVEEPVSKAKPWIKWLLQGLALAFLALALANPQYGTQNQKVERKGSDLVFALDVSRSMLCEDLAPSRLQYAKQLISSALSNLGGERVGLVVYAGSAYPQLPLTTDYGAARMMLQTADPDMVSAQGTAMAQALETALELFDQNTEQGKTLVVISDGEDHEAGWESTMEQLAAAGIQVHTLGVGTPAGGPIPLGGGSFKKDRKGEVVITTLSTDALKKMAATGGGEFLLPRDIAEATEAISNWVAGKKASAGEEVLTVSYQDQFSIFLLLALLCLMADLLLTSSATRWIKKLNA